MEHFATLIITRSRVVLVAAVLIVLLSGAWGLGVISKLNLAGYADPTSESAAVDLITTEHFGRQAPDIVAIYTAPPGKSLLDIQVPALAAIGSVDKSLLTKPIESYWGANPITRIGYASSNQRKALAVVTLAGSDGDRLKAYPDVVRALTPPGIETEFAGYSAVTDAYNTESKRDIVRVESIAIPVTLLLLIIIFGGLVAAAIPVCVGALSVFGTLGTLRLMAEFTDVSAFALNIAAVLGLGMAIDYGLFVVSRFREEIRAGLSVNEAVQRTIRTAGRTVGFSALLLMCAFAGMLTFRVPMMRSLGLGGMSAVALSAILSITAVPALLMIIGPKVDALTWRRGAVDRGEARARRIWTRVANGVLRHPVAIASGIACVMLVMALPVLGIHAAGLENTGLPADNSARMAQQVVSDEFPYSNNGALVLLESTTDAAPDSAARGAVLEQIRRTEGVSTVVQLSADDRRVLFRAVLKDQDFSNGVLDTIHRLRSQIAAPDGIRVMIGGENAVGVDSNDAILAGMPIMAAIMVLATLVLLGLAFRSVVLPLKAVLMAGISLAATFGVLTWIFQEGHGAGLLGVAQGPLPVAALVVIVAAVFGLSTDYEVFLISRITEYYRSSGNTGEAIRSGMATTGRIITAAASLLLIVTAAASLSDVSLMKVAGFGMAFAILIDATIVRMLLVPALIKLMGRFNWWLPDGKERTEQTATRT